MKDDRHGRHRRADPDRRRRPVDGFRVRDLRRFQRLVEDAIAGLPAGLLVHLDGVQLAVTDLPPPDGPGGRADEVALGVYEAAPVRGGGRTPRPDRVTLYRRPLEARATSRPDLADLIRDTVVHELADHLGIDDDRLDELGWD